MLFAEMDGSFGALMMILFFIYGTGRAVKMISGNSTARTTVRKGVFHIVGRLFK